MSLKYLPVRFYCSFERPAKQDTYLPFVLRSVLGAQLRKMCCVTKRNQCSRCMFQHNCVYSIFFETNIDKGNSILPGRNTASHPFAFTQFASDIDDDNLVYRFNWTITFFGKGISYLPYIYSALVQAGVSGLFSDRVPFNIDDVMVGHNSIVLNEDQIRTDIDPYIFDENAVRQIPSKVRIDLISPLRTQINGKYIMEMTVIDLFNAIYRRYKTMMTLYGEHYQKGVKPLQRNIEFEQSDFYWRNYSRYSARQKQSMKLCGLIGYCVIKGELTQDIMTLLEFGRIANIGKNTNFGFGQMKYKALN